MKKKSTASIGFIGRIQKSYTSVCQKASVALLTGVSASGSNLALAAGGVTLGSVGTNAGNNATGLTSGALLIAGFVGVVMVIIAFVKGRSAKQQGEGIGSYVAMAALGALLLAVPTVISIINNSVIGSDASSGMQGQIITQ